MSFVVHFLVFVTFSAIAHSQQSSRAKLSNIERSSFSCDFDRFSDNGCPASNSSCILGDCHCPPSYHVNLETTEGYPICLRSKQLGQECLSDNQCDYRDVNSYCRSNGGGRHLRDFRSMSSDEFDRLRLSFFLGTCTCKFDYYPDSQPSGSHCVQYLKHGEECRSSRQCQQYDFRATCRMRSEMDISICTCMPGYRYNETIGLCDLLDPSAIVPFDNVINCTFHNWDHVNRVCRTPSYKNEERDHALSIVMAVLCLSCFLCTCVFVCCFSPKSRSFCFKNYALTRRPRNANTPGLSTPAGISPAARRNRLQAVPTPRSPTTVEMYTTIQPSRRPQHLTSDRLRGAAQVRAPLRIEGQAVPDPETLFWLKMIAINAQSKRLNSVEPPSYDEALHYPLPRAASSTHSSEWTTPNALLNQQTSSL